MEIEVRNLRYTYKGKGILHHISATFDSRKIVGIVGVGKSLFLEILDLQKKVSGQIFIDHELVGFSNRLQFQRQIALIPQKNIFLTSTVLEEMKFVMNYYHYEGKDLEKRMIDSLRFVGLDSSFLTRKIETLSNSEKILLKVSCSLIMNPKVILLDEVFVGLDHSSKKMLLKLFKRLQEKKDRLIILASNDSDLLYEFTDQLLILEKGTILKMGSTLTIFKDVKFLNQHQIDVPNLVAFTTLAKEKKVKLSYHRDILDLIKDVYKHV